MGSFYCLRWMERIPGVCFAEESCEAMLSRLSNRCEAHRTLRGFDATFHLFLTMPPPNRMRRSTRGSLRQGLVQVFAARVRKLVFGNGHFPWAHMANARDMHSVFTESPHYDAISFPLNFPEHGDVAVVGRVLRCVLRTLTGKSASMRCLESVARFMEEHVPSRDAGELAEYEASLAKLHEGFRGAPKPVRRAPQPRKVRVVARDPPAWKVLVC